LKAVENESQEILRQREVYSWSKKGSRYLAQSIEPLNILRLKELDLMIAETDG
jgi:hypothetical protein